MSELINSMFPLADRFGFAHALLFFDHHLRRPTLFLGGFVRANPESSSNTNNLNFYFFFFFFFNNREKRKGSDNGTLTSSRLHLFLEKSTLKIASDPLLNPPQNRQAFPMQMCRYLFPSGSCSFSIFIADIRSPPPRPYVLSTLENSCQDLPPLLSICSILEYQIRTFSRWLKSQVNKTHTLVLLLWRSAFFIRFPQPSLDSSNQINIHWKV